ncbi:MAG TPA: hypothetical protein VKA38_13900 [Draconibacterium sp.]|nr:hypothetical protein [Draconibacterium sp.]
MEKINSNDLIIRKISELIPEAPHDWAKIIAKKMGKTEVSIYAYARGERGLRRGYPLQLLKHLNELVIEKEQEIEKITA